LHTCHVVSAIIEHTNQVIYLEDGDVAAVQDGKLVIHRVTPRDPNDSSVREVTTIKTAIQEIMKGKSTWYTV